MRGIRGRNLGPEAGGQSALLPGPPLPGGMDVDASPPPALSD